LAGRIMHLGRYGGDAQSPLMRDLSVGYPSLVRGYEPGSFTAAECAVSGAQTGIQLWRIASLQRAGILYRPAEFRPS